MSMDSAKENPKVPLLTFLHMFLWFNELFSKSNICCVARYQIPKQSYSWQQKRTPKICKMLSLNTSCKEWILQTPAQWHIIRCCKSVTTILEFLFQKSFISHLHLLIPGQVIFYYVFDFQYSFLTFVNKITYLRFVDKIF